MTYYVQLPPEYDPYRLYPAVVTLSAEVTTAGQQIDWWAGPAVAGGPRTGQATRQGYIVIAPVWTVEQQGEYAYSAREHAAVLNSLRDAHQDGGRRDPVAGMDCGPAHGQVGATRSSPHNLFAGPRLGTLALEIVSS